MHAHPEQRPSIITHGGSLESPTDLVCEICLSVIPTCLAILLVLMQESRLTDGAGQKPAYNLRTLSRALDYARAMTPVYGLQRSLYDGAAMAFQTQLDPASAARLEALIIKHLLPGVKNIRSLNRTPPEPQGNLHVLFEQFWLERGREALPAGGREVDGSGRRFVATASVRQHLCNLARAVLIR